MCITKTRLYKYIENFTFKNWKFSDQNLCYISYFCSKHRLWVLVRTASLRRFLRVPTIYVLCRNKKNNVYPCKPQFYYIKVGFKGVKTICAYFIDHVLQKLPWLIIGQRYAKTCLWAYAGSEGPDKPAHPRSLIRTFAVRKQNHWLL